MIVMMDVSYYMNRRFVLTLYYYSFYTNLYFSKRLSFVYGVQGPEWGYALSLHR